MPHDLVMFGEDWDGHPSSTQHLARNLLASRKILWVNSLGLRRPRFTQHDFIRASQKIAALLRKSAPKVQAPLPENLTLVSPRALCWPGSRIVQLINGQSLSRQIEPIRSAKNFSKPILWTSLPTAVPVIGKLNERALVYYCGDDFGALAGVDHGPVLKLEQHLAAKADLILAASPQIAARFSDKKTRVIAHGADVDLFAAPVPRAPDLPKGKPIAGFYGSLSDWIDVERLTQAAKDLPDWDFVFVGPVHTNAASLSALPNVHFLGARSHHLLPGYAQHWNVSMLPFRDNDQIRACNPLKLREYLAAGTPIVSTPFPAMQPFAALISVARDGQPLSEALRIATLDTARNPMRQASVQGATWAARAREVAGLLDQL